MRLSSGGIQNGCGGKQILWQTGWIVVRISQFGSIAEDPAVGKKTIRVVNLPVLRPLSGACWIAVSHVASDLKLKLGGEHAGFDMRVENRRFLFR
jgi:hypothetical protein